MVDPAEELRAFNRFYTKKIGLLNEHLGPSPFTLTEARILFELGHQTVDTASDLSRLLGLDKGYLSRILAKLRKQGLVESRISPKHARHHLLALTDNGSRAFQELESAANGQMSALITPLAVHDAQRLLAASREIRTILDGDKTGQGGPFHLRDPQPGDLGWVIQRQAILYHREYGWDRQYEGLIAGIISRFVEQFDPMLEQCWIAERAGEAVGAIFLVQSGAPGIGQLRLLHVEPSARGLGIGSALADACVKRARAIGYRQLMLWTNDVLVSARRIYEAAGFQLVKQETHRSFGHDLNGQTWILNLV